MSEAATNALAEALREACQKLGYDIVLRELSPRTEIGVRNYIERSVAIADALLGDHFYRRSSSAPNQAARSNGEEA